MLMSSLPITSGYMCSPVLHWIIPVIYTVLGNVSDNLDSSSNVLIWLWGGRSQIQFWAGTKDFSLFQNGQAGSWFHLVSWPVHFCWGGRGSSQGVDLSTCLHLMLRFLMYEARSTLNPLVCLHSVDGCIFTFSFLVKLSVSSTLSAVYFILFSHINFFYITVFLSSFSIMWY